MTARQQVHSHHPDAAPSGGPPLDVLLLDSEGGRAETEHRRLTEAGHRVVRCHEPGLAAFPCNGLLEDAGCPLDRPGVDVAVVVRRHAWPRPSAYEDGVACALRRGVPVVVAGRTALNPYHQWAMAEADRLDDLDAACRAAVARRNETLAAGARRAVEQVLHGEGLPSGPVAVTVERRPDRVRAVLTLPAGLPTALRTLAAERAAGAIRAADPDPGHIEVAVDDVVGDEPAAPAEEL